MAQSKEEFIYEGMSPEEVNEFEADSKVTRQTAPIVEEEATPAPVETAPVVAPEGQPAPVGQQDPRMVDVRALQEARAAQRAAEQRAAQFEQQTREERARIDERLKVINEALAGNSRQEAPKPPTKDEDPLGFYDHQLDSVNGKFQSLEQKLEAFEKAEQTRIAAESENNRRQQVIAQADNAYQQARTKYPEIDDALSFAGQKLRDEVARVVAEAGHTGDQFQAEFTRLYNGYIFDVQSKMPRDLDAAAEHIRRHARYWGWSQQQGQQQAPIPGQVQPQPVQTMPQAQPQAQPQQIQASPQQRADQQQRHMSLSGTQGGQPPLQLDAKSLASMTDEEFFNVKRTVEGRKKIASIQAGN